MNIAKGFEFAVGKFFGEMTISLIAGAFCLLLVIVCAIFGKKR